MKRITIQLAIACLLAGAYVAPGQAALTNSTCNGTRALGDCTFDSLSGLHWLDFTISINRNYNQVKLTDLAPGGDFFGFRFATQADLLALIANAGILGGLTHLEFPPDPDVETLLNFVGTDGLSGFPAMIATFEGPICGVAPCAGNVDTVRISTDTVAVSQIETGFIAANAPASPIYGHALVAQNVPEPSALLLLGMGLAALAARRKLRSPNG